VRNVQARVAASSVGRWFLASTGDFLDIASPVTSVFDRSSSSAVSEWILNENAPRRRASCCRLSGSGRPTRSRTRRALRPRRRRRPRCRSAAGLSRPSCGADPFECLSGTKRSAWRIRQTIQVCTPVVREDGVDRLREAIEAVDSTDQDVALFEFVEHLQPNLAPSKRRS
jgi:hypothetical protein